MKREKKILVDTIWEKIRNNKFFAILIVAGAIIISLATFADSLLTLFRTADNLIEDGQTTKILDQAEALNGSIPSSSFQNYLNNNFQIADNLESDIVNISKDGLAMDFSVNNSESDLMYNMRHKEEEIEINPFHKYLTLLKNGGPISPIFYYHVPFEFQFPTFDIKVVNNSKETIFFTKAIFDVSKSEPDLFPILLIAGPGYNMRFPLINIGWGKVLNCIVNFNLIPTDYPSDNFFHPLSGVPFKGSFDTTYRHQMVLGDFGYSSDRTDLSNYFKSLGVDISNIKYGDIEEARGPFKSGVAKMYGEIFYEGINAAGSTSKEKLRFECDISLYDEGAGAPLPPSFEYDISLDSDNDNYRKMVSLSQAIKPSESDRFTIKISAPQSSRHRFNLTFIYNDNRSLVVPNISLNYFMTRPDSFLIRSVLSP